MSLDQLRIFVGFLARQGYQVFNPQPSQKREGVFLIKKIKPEVLLLNNQIPFYGWKKFFLPHHEKLLNLSQDKAHSQNTLSVKLNRKKALLGINLIDLKAVALYDAVFESDFNYQNRRQNLLIIGHNLMPEAKGNIFEEQYKIEALSSLRFDIFLAQKTDNNWQVFTGSPLGAKLLQDFKGIDFKRIQFNGLNKQDSASEQWLAVSEKLKNDFNQQLWQDLGERCLECSKCSFVCPTCFCFGCSDMVKITFRGFAVSRCRQWDSCFNDDFSEVAGGHKFLDTIAKRVHFWYYHKFVRIFEQYSMPGCVGCGRCTEVCPANINLKDNIIRILNG